MAIWQNIRRLASSGSVQGVQNPGPVEVLTPAQAVQILDDASIAVAPPRVPWIMAEFIGALPAGGEFSGAEIQARAGGLWILQTERSSVNAGNQALRSWRDDDQVTTVRTVNQRVWATGAANGVGPVSAFFEIRVAAFPGNAVLFNSADGPTPWGFFVAPGERIFIVASNANIAVGLTLWCREVPIIEQP